MTVSAGTLKQKFIFSSISYALSNVQRLEKQEKYKMNEMIHVNPQMTIIINQLFLKYLFQLYYTDRMIPPHTLYFSSSLVLNHVVKLHQAEIQSSESSTMMPVIGYLST